MLAESSARRLTRGTSTAGRGTDLLRAAADANERQAPVVALDEDRGERRLRMWCELRLVRSSTRVPLDRGIERVVFPDAGGLGIPGRLRAVRREQHDSLRLDA